MPAATPTPTPSLPLLLIPGLACSPRLFAPQLPALWRYGPVTIAQPTYGENMAEMAAHILQSAPPLFVLMGLSMGGYIAFEILRQAPERVLALALLDTSARPDSDEARQQRLRMVALAQQGKLPLAVELNYPRSVHPSRADDAALRAAVQAMAQETGVDAFVRQQTAIMSRPDSRPALARIACPSLVLVGDADAITPPEIAAEIAATIPGAQLRTIAHCGHLSTLEQPEAVTTALCQWLDGLLAHGQITAP